MNAPRRVSPEPARRGWCPSLARPMPTGDGLLARIHPPLGVISPTQARTVATGARRYGNGHIDVTARANLQVRGVSEETGPKLAALLDVAGLGDVRNDGGPQRLTLTAPLSGRDVIALAHAVEQIGVGIPHLPAKAVVTIEAVATLPVRGQPERAGDFWGTEPDIRLVVVAPDRFAVAFAGSDWHGDIEVERLPVIVGAALRILAASGQRRMRDLHTGDLAASLGLRSRSMPPLSPLRPAGISPLADGRTALLLDTPFGRCTADALDRLADQAEAMDSEIHLSPTRGFAILAADETALRSARDALADLFITEPDDPRRAVAACPGAPACGSGSTSTLVDAARLAAVFEPLAARGLSAHVSGCSKGCAHPGAASLTLVGRDGYYGIVLDGRPDALPTTLLTFDAALDRVRSAEYPRLDALAHAFRTQT
ncbi:hypothetical protein [Methylobacterium sp. 77]|uniref:hypothetical protein n=1 Tax=Methylobacterium sp. 77 TaxID=1101192 RepID=UPI0004792239|nr:hypothetical protein [Methylobacterium sp. 77]